MDPYNQSLIHNLSSWVDFNQSPDDESTFSLLQPVLGESGNNFNNTTAFPIVPTNGVPRSRTADCSQGLHLMRYIGEVVISLPIAMLGIIGNVLAFIVLLRQKQRLTTTLLLQALAITDTLILISFVLGRGFRYLALCNNAPAYLEVFPEIFRWIYPMAYFFRQTDVWLVTLLTIDRWIAVCKPLHAQRLCTLSRAYKQMAGVTLGALVVTLPRFFEVSTNDKGQFAFHWIMRVKSYTITYRISLFFLFMYLVPMALLVILNTKLLKTLRKADIYRAALRESRDQNASCMTGFRSITSMVVTVVITCIVCNSMAIVSHILFSLVECFRKDLHHLEIYRRYTSQISNVLLTINSAVNFVIYCMCSKSFRSSFARMFCTCPGYKTTGVRPSKRLSGGPFSTGSGTGQLYISLPQIGDRRKNMSVKQKDVINLQHQPPQRQDTPPTPPPQLLNKVSQRSQMRNGTAFTPGCSYKKHDKTEATQL